ncbi:hypothetical protein [Actinokineospora sp.]
MTEAVECVVNELERASRLADELAALVLGGSLPTAEFECFP